MKNKKIKGGLMIDNSAFDDFKSHYADDETCHRRLFEIIWPDGWKCPICGAAGYDYLSTRKLYQCKKCRRQTSATAGTIMHGSHLPLHKWFRAIYILGRNYAVKAVALRRELDVSYQTVLKIKLKIKKVIKLSHRRRDRELFAAIAGVEPSNFGKALMPDAGKAEPN
jgi:transposase-like protein